MSETFLGHPKGLVVCFLTELWERFAYYGMMSLLILYLTKEYLLSDEKGNLIVAAYGALVWMAPVVGGIIADRFLGSRKAVLLGGFLMAFGFLSMSFPDLLAWLFAANEEKWALDTMFLSMATIITGVGFFKPNITTVVGALYEEGDPKREIGFTAFYMAINAGGALGAIVCGGIGEWFGLRYGFSAAGIAMIVALVFFVSGQRLLGRRTEPPNQHRLRQWIVPGVNVETAIYLGAILMIALFWQAMQFYVLVTGALIWFAMGLGAFIIYFSVFRCNPKERNRLLGLTILITFTIVFWSLSMQIFGSLVLFSDRLVDREVLGFEIAASQLQGLPATIMIFMTPVVGFVWIWLGRHRRNPSVPVKFSLALVLAGCAFLMPALGAGFVSGDMKVGLFWFLMIYLLMVTGELCQAPIALSVITKLSPRRVVGMMVGAGFVALSVGSLLGGILAARYTMVAQNADGSLADPIRAMATYTSAYFSFGVVAIGFGAVLYLSSPFILYLMQENEDDNAPSFIQRLYQRAGIVGS